MAASLIYMTTTKTTTRRGRQTETVTTITRGNGTAVQQVDRFYDGERTETYHWSIDVDGGCTRCDAAEFEDWAEAASEAAAS